MGVQGAAAPCRGAGCPRRFPFSPKGVLSMQEKKSKAQQRSNIMRIKHVMWRKSYLLIASLALILTFIFVLAACGSNPTTGGTAPTPTATATPTPTFTTVQGYGSSHGCPSDAVVSTTPRAPNAVGRFPTNNTTITVHVGDIVEIDLPFGERWTGPTNPQTMLQLQEPAGYAWKVKNACVWRFVAQSVGTTQVSFLGRAICVKGQLCPQYLL